MSHPKKSKASNLKYISKERKKEVERVFNTLGLVNQNNLTKYFPSTEDYNMPFKQFSVLKNKKTIFSSSS